MKYYNDYIELVGNTPIVKLNRMGFPVKIGLFAKMELTNPNGSVKDRMGRAIIEAAERDGKLKKDSVIVEATAGNAGIGIAFAALGKYPVIFVVPQKFSQEKQDIMKALGAEIINTPRELGLKGAFEKIKEILKENKNAVYLDQFSNMANPAVHFETTGREIYSDMDGQIDYFVCGAGTGGTMSGVMKYLKSKNKNIKGILADPIGSTMGGGTDNYYAIEGIGNSFMPKTMDMSLVDEVFKVSDDEAFHEVKQLVLREGILAGSSSGAVLAVARKLSEKISQGNVVVLFADRGDRYLSKNIYV